MVEDRDDDDINYINTKCAIPINLLMSLSFQQQRLNLELVFVFIILS